MPHEDEVGGVRIPEIDIPAAVTLMMESGRGELIRRMYLPNYASGIALVVAIEKALEESLVKRESEGE